MDYQVKGVDFKILRKLDLSFGSDQAFTHVGVILYLQANGLIKKLYEVYLVSLISTRKDKQGLQDIPVVKEISEIFSQELLKLSYDREIEFPIDLVSGTYPISKVPYNMVYVELKELKAKQL